MQYGIHLPQAGPAASAKNIQLAAKQAEDLGFANVWVSDHIAIPAQAAYPPSKYIIDPLIALTWAAAATEEVGLATSVLVIPLRQPVVLANMLASLDCLSNGRVLVGGASGWLKEEFAAVGVPFAKRGVLTDEAIDIMRLCWNEDHLHYQGQHHSLVMQDIRVLPQPSKTIPIWIGGHSEAALNRAVTKGDGWHGGFRSPAECIPIVKRLRRDRPESSFTLSMRTRWDGLTTASAEIQQQLDEYEEIGVQHIVAEPAQKDIDSWLKSVEYLAKTFALI